MRVRTQKNNIMIPPKYEKDVSSVLVYDDEDRVIFAVTISPVGSYKFTHVGLPEFKQEIKQITGLTIGETKLHEIDIKNG